MGDQISSTKANGLRKIEPCEASQRDEGGRGGARKRMSEERAVNERDVPIKE